MGMDVPIIGDKAMKKILAAWNLKTINEALNIHKHLADTGNSWENVELYLRGAVDIGQNATSKGIQRPVCACPICGRPMRVYPVNADPKKRDRVLSKDGKEYKSMWLCGTSCSGKGCLYEEYSFLTAQEEIKNKVPGSRFTVQS